jgi:hypothetical protein
LTFIWNIAAQISSVWISRLIKSLSVFWSWAIPFSSFGNSIFFINYTFSSHEVTKSRIWFSWCSPILSYSDLCTLGLSISALLLPFQNGYSTGDTIPPLLFFEDLFLPLPFSPQSIFQPFFFSSISSNCVMGSVSNGSGIPGCRPGWYPHYTQHGQNFLVQSRTCLVTRPCFARVLAGFWPGFRFILVGRHNPKFYAAIQNLSSDHIVIWSIATRYSVWCCITSRSPICNLINIHSVALENAECSA